MSTQEKHPDGQVVYLDTVSGIAGDMLLAALVDAGADRLLIESKIQSLGIPDVTIDFVETRRCGFRALLLDITHPESHHHRRLSDISQMIQQSSLNSREKDWSLKIFYKLAQAEAQVHGMGIDEVHFHEVGALDSIVDIVGITVALDDLNAHRIESTPPPTGSGTICIEHGMVSVPAPATAELLKGIPIRSSTVEAELTTPTGAAVLATLVDRFGSIPDMTIQKIGYGAGRKDFAQQPNILRVLIGSQDLSRRDNRHLRDHHHDHHHH